MTTTIDDMQAASEKLSAILDEMNQCVARVEDMLAPARSVGTVYFDGLLRKTEWHIAWMRMGNTFRIVVQINGLGESRAWANTPACYKLAVFSKLPGLVATIQRELERSLAQAFECKALLPDIDTLLGTPAPASGGKGET